MLETRPIGTSNFIRSLAVGTYVLALLFLLNFVNELSFELLVHIVSFEDQDYNFFQLISLFPTTYSLPPDVGTTDSK